MTSLKRTSSRNLLERWRTCFDMMGNSAFHDIESSGMPDKDEWSPTHLPSPCHLALHIPSSNHQRLQLILLTLTEAGPCPIDIQQVWQQYHAPSTMVPRLLPFPLSTSKELPFFMSQSRKAGFAGWRSLGRSWYHLLSRRSVTWTTTALAVTGPVTWRYVWLHRWGWTQTPTKRAASKKGAGKSMVGS